MHMTRDLQHNQLMEQLQNSQIFTLIWAAKEAYTPARTIASSNCSPTSSN